LSHANIRLHTCVKYTNLYLNLYSLDTSNLLTSGIGAH
jgi:hypothetical protein